MGQRRNIAVVASQYNPEYVRGLIEHFQREMLAVGPGTVLRVFQVPGAFEIPVVAQELAERGGIDAIVAFGVVIEGETRHAELIGTAVTNALMDCALRYRLPVIHEVLVVRDENQARTRCLESEVNRGTEAARAVLHAAQVMADVRGR